MALSVACRGTRQKLARQVQSTFGSLSFTYLEEWEKRGVSFADRLDFGGARSRFPGKDQNFAPADFPELTRNIVRLEAALGKDYFPVVHAHPQWIAVAMVVASRIYGAPDDFLSLRPPVGQSVEEVKAHVLKEYAKGKRDMDPGIREHLVSASYALTSSLAIADSALFHGFRLNQRSDLFPVGLRVLTEALEHHGMGREEAHSVATMLGHGVWEKCQQMNAGEFYVLGLPTVDPVYDAKAWGIPTGNDVVSIMLRPGQCPRFEKGHALRVIMCKETTDPAFGMKVIQARNVERVDALAKELQDPREYGLFRTLCPFESTVIEQEDMARRAEISHHVRAFIEKYIA